MPRFLVVSDVHCEFHRDGGFDFIESLAKDVDAVLLAGDIATKSGLDFVISRFCEVYPRVVFVTGNHEFYGSNREEIVDLLRGIEAKSPTFSFLDNQTVTVAGQRVVGTPLWFERVSGSPTWAMNDFSQIKDFEAWVYEENRKARNFLEEEVRDRDIVLTHYLPSPKCIHPRYAGSPLNVFFMCNVEHVMTQYSRPAYWVHGHTHSSVDTVVGATRIVCNPFGYVGYETNPEFREDLIIET